MSEFSQKLRESAKATFYDPLKSELNQAADCIDELVTALRALSNTCDCWAAVEERLKAMKLLEKNDANS